MAGVALDHRRRLEGSVGDLSHGKLLVVSLLSRDDRRVRGEDEVDAGVRHEVGLELSDIDAESTIEAERRSERRDALSNQTVQVGVGRALNVEVAAADIVDGLIVN